MKINVFYLVIIIFISIFVGMYIQAELDLFCVNSTEVEVPPTEDEKRFKREPKSVSDEMNIIHFL